MPSVSGGPARPLSVPCTASPQGRSQAERFPFPPTLPPAPPRSPAPPIVASAKLQYLELYRAEYLIRASLGRVACRLCVSRRDAGRPQGEPQGRAQEPRGRGQTRLPFSKGTLAIRVLPTFEAALVQAD